MKKNIVLFDSSYEEAEDFIEGLNVATNFDWQPIVCNSNKKRSKLYNIIRYIKYFSFPFAIFLKRKKYNYIIGWQEFYGLIFAFYCKLFKVKKRNKVIIKNFIYNPKKGFVGKIYYKFLKYIVSSNYIDLYICASNKMVDFCALSFNIPKEKFIFLQFGVNDFSKKITNEIDTENFALSIGRSNRDWNFLIKSFKEIDYNLKIICDTLDNNIKTPNVEVLNNVHGNEALYFMKRCKFLIISIDKPNIASGDTVLLQAMSLSKPIVITKPSCLADDYVIDGYNGLIINKDIKELKNAIAKLLNDEKLYKTLSENSRTTYLDKHSLLYYGKKVGNEILKRER